MDLSIVIVNWNSADYLLECVKSIREQTEGVSYEIIVVDNSSKPEDLNKLRENSDGMTIIASQENLGFAKANNLGFKISTGDRVLFLNPDTRLVGPAINTMLQKTGSLTDAGIVGCKLLNADRSVQLSSIQRFPTILNQMLDFEYLQVRWPNSSLWGMAPLFSEVKLARAEVISGACMLVNRKVFERIGMFSEDYFMYAEDVDLSYKSYRAGFSNYYVGEALVVHFGGGSSSRQEVSHWATIMKYTAMRRMFDKNRGRLYGSLFRAAVGCAAVGRIILLALAYPLGNILWNRQTIQTAMRKWKVILSWAIGSQGMVLMSR